MDDYNNHLDKKSDAKVSSKKGKKRKTNQNALPEEARNQDDIEDGESRAQADDVAQSGGPQHVSTDNRNVQPERVSLKVKPPTKKKSSKKTNNAVVRRSETEVDMENAEQQVSNAHGVSQTDVPFQNSEVVNSGPKPTSRKRKRKKSQKNGSNDKVPRKKSKAIRPQMADEGFAEAHITNDIPEENPHQGYDSGMEDDPAEGVNNVPVRNYSADENNQSGNAATRLEKYMSYLFIPNFI